MFDVDVVVAGGGPGGVATAAALGALGMRVLLVDAGVSRARVLAGELLHPAACEDLTRLALGAALQRAGGTPIRGFAVVDERPGTKRASVLPYPRGERGLAVEHAAVMDALLEDVTQHRNVEVRRHTRVSAVGSNDVQGGIELTLTPKSGQPTTVRARLLVGADGRASPVRKLLGIEEAHQRLSSMIGVLVPAETLPYAAHGHLFVGGPAPVLAYDIGGGHARVMVDLPLGSAAELVGTDERILSGVPEPLRSAIGGALGGATQRTASNDTRLPSRVTEGAAVLVGDAAGCCHPVSASGISSATRDARVLEAALRETGLDVGKALNRYVAQRRPAQRTRIALASALYQAFASQEPEMAALRSGLFRYWHETEDGAPRSMSLLSTRESRMWHMAREYSRVVGHGMFSLARDAYRGEPRDVPRIAQAAAGLLGSALPWVQGAVAGTVESLEGRLGRRLRS